MSVCRSSHHIPPLDTALTLSGPLDVHLRLPWHPGHRTWCNGTTPRRRCNHHARHSHIYAGTPSTRALCRSLFMTEAVYRTLPCQPQDSGSLALHPCPKGGPRAVTLRDTALLRCDCPAHLAHVPHASAGAAGGSTVPDRGNRLI